MGLGERAPLLGRVSRDREDAVLRRCSEGATIQPDQETENDGKRSEGAAQPVTSQGSDLG